MRKRLTAILITLIAAVTLLPVSAMAVTTKDEAQIKAAVSAVITDYAAEVYRPNADEDAFSDYFKHGFYGNGKAMTLTEDSAKVYG